MASKPNDSDLEFNRKLLSKINYLFGTDEPAASPPAVLPGHAARLSISTADMNKLWDLFFGWSESFAKSKNEITSTALIRKAKNDLRQQAELHWKKIKRDIVYSALTNDDRFALFIPARKSKSRVQVPEGSPRVTLLKAIHGMHKFRFSHPATPDSHAMPRGNKIFLEKFIGPDGLKEVEIKFTDVEIVSKSIHHVYHEEKDVGKMLYYRTRYITTAGRKGIPGNVFKIGVI